MAISETRATKVTTAQSVQLLRNGRDFASVRLTGSATNAGWEG